MKRTSLIGLAGLGYLFAPDTASAQEQTFTLGGCDGCTFEQAATANSAMADAVSNLNGAPAGVLYGRFSSGSTGNLPVFFTGSCAPGVETCGNQSENGCTYYSDNHVRCNPNTLNNLGVLITGLMHEGVHAIGGYHAGQSGCLMSETTSVFSGWTSCDYDYFWTFGS